MDKNATAGLEDAIFAGKNCFLFFCTYIASSTQLEKKNVGSIGSSFIVIDSSNSVLLTISCGFITSATLLSLLIFYQI